MAFTSLEFTQKIPFKKVLVHPTVMTKDGRRMSKSLGTGLNPMDLVRIYGADATRFSLLQQAGAMQDVRFDAEIEDNKVKSSQSAKSGQMFCNKLWNAARFVLMNLDGYQPVKSRSCSDELADRWIRSSLASTIELVDRHQEAFQFNEVTRALYTFLWNDYCDWYVELAKTRLQGGSTERAIVQELLVEILEQALRLMHPVMPFVTEALWQALPKISTEGSIMVASWPTRVIEDVDAKAEYEMGIIQDVISAVRNIRSELRVPPGKKINVVISAGADMLSVLSNQAGYIQVCSQASEVKVGENVQKPPSSGSAVIKDIELYVPLEGLIDIDEESRRIQKEIDKFTKLLNGIESKLNQEKFLSKAPQDVIDRERERKKEYTESLSKLEDSLSTLIN